MDTIDKKIESDNEIVEQLFKLCIVEYKRGEQEVKVSSLEEVVAEQMFQIWKEKLESDSIPTVDSNA